MPSEATLVCGVILPFLGQVLLWSGINSSQDYLLDGKVRQKHLEMNACQGKQFGWGGCAGESQGSAHGASKV